MNMLPRLVRYAALLGMLGGLIPRLFKNSSTTGTSGLAAEALNNPFKRLFHRMRKGDEGEKEGGRGRGGVIKGANQAEAARDAAKSERLNHINSPGISLCMLLIARDEANNIRAHLPLWNQDETLFDCYVAGIDSRSTDDTANAILRAMGEDIPGVIFDFEYDGLGNARTEVLKVAWEHFAG